jgi:hypothetical protein
MTYKQTWAVFADRPGLFHSQTISILCNYRTSKHPLTIPHQWLVRAGGGDAIYVHLFRFDHQVNVDETVIAANFGEFLVRHFFAAVQRELVSPCPLRYDSPRFRRTATLHASSLQVNRYSFACEPRHGKNRARFLFYIF